MSTNSDSLAGSAGSAGALAKAISALGDVRTRARALWDAYWDYQLRRTTVLVLESLDDRVLKDIGVPRSEIRPAVFGNDPARARPYNPHWRRPFIS
jgi:uncharacterized protein YjiS (DUF1127 family)